MKIRSAVPENGCLVFLTDEKKQKNTSVKHIRIRLIGGCVNKFCKMLAVYQSHGTVTAQAQVNSW